MVRGRRLTRASVAVTAFVVLATGCSGSNEATVTESQFSAAMTERFGATGAQAHCITNYVFSAYDAPEIEVLAADGMGALPQARWSPYLNASAACITHDQPVDADG